MAEPLKNLYNPLFFEALCPALHQHVPAFNKKRFLHNVFDTEWPDLELKQRVRKVTVALNQFMPDDFPEAASIITRLSNAIRSTEGVKISFAYIFLPDYIELYGQNHVDESIAALEEITQLVSAEFAIRPFILQNQKETMERMKKWSLHNSHHVRRLSSEGCRPRLPWAVALPAFKEDPSIIIPILENLKKDNSEFVRKSVANNLNDIAKDHPDLVLEIAARWKGLSKETDWILKHGSRTLLKNGYTDALNFHGFNPKLKSAVHKLTISRQVKIGKSASFSFELLNQENKTKMYRLEYAITFITASGKSSRKVFKICEKSISPKSKVAITRNHRFTDFTTRKHFPGKHALEVIVNGVSKATVLFSLVR